MSMQVPMEQHSREPEFLESAARLTMLSRLAGALAHEFRNPLTTIFLHADIPKMHCADWRVVRARRSYTFCT